MTDSTTNVTSRGEKKQQSRNAILNAAIQLFSTVGFEAASIGNIAQEAGVKKALVQYHFETKDNLWKETVRTVWQRREEALPELFRGLLELGKDEVLREIFKRIMTFAAENPSWVAIMFKEASQPSERLDWLIDEYVRDDFNNGRDFVELAQREGMLPDVHPMHLLHILSGALTYVLSVAPMHERVLGIDPTSDEYLDEHIDVLMTLLNFATTSK